MGTGCALPIAALPVRSTQPALRVVSGVEGDVKLTAN